MPEDLSESQISEDDLLEQLILPSDAQTEFGATVHSNQQYELNDEKIKEQRQRRKYREVMFKRFFALLVFQHILLAIFIGCIICIGSLPALQPLLVVIIPATLGETYIIMRQMVQFIFQPGDYELPDKNKSK